MTITVRWVLTAALLAGVYFETGWATTLSGALIYVAIELLTAQIKKLDENVSRLIRVWQLQQPPRD